VNSSDCMTCQEFELSGADGGVRFARAWAPPKDARGTVGIVHGLGEHSGRYLDVAEHFLRSGFAVVAFDQIGHGRSGGPRGHGSDYSLLLDDLAVLVGELQRRGDGRLPRFLYGHSLGGSLVLNFALRRRPELTGLIVTSPLLRPAVRPPRWKLVLGHALNRLCPQLTLETGIDPADLSHDPQAVQRYRDDPLVHHRVSARLGIQMLAAGSWALEHADGLALPTLLMHGAADRVTSADASREFAARAGSMCTLKVWPDGFHELHWESNRNEVLAIVLEWLNKALIEFL
jgi:alpha-beta hydrolase superfamily lysophospholipase